MKTIDEIARSINRRIAECMRGPGLSLHDELVTRLLGADDSEALRRAGENPLMDEWMAQAAFLSGMARLKYRGIPDALHPLTDLLAEQVSNVLWEGLKDLRAAEPDGKPRA